MSIEHALDILKNQLVLSGVEGANGAEILEAFNLVFEVCMTKKSYYNKGYKDGVDAIVAHIELCKEEEQYGNK